MKKFSRLVSLAALPVVIGALTACGGNGGSNYGSIKVGLILLHPSASSTYDKNFYDAMIETKDELGIELIVKENIPESDECERTAKQLAEEGCDIVFADSFGHEDYMIAAAEAYPEVEFCHATGTRANEVNTRQTNPVKNYHNAFASIY